MGRGGGEGRVPSLMTAAVEREALIGIFDCYSVRCVASAAVLAVLSQDTYLLP